MLNKNRYRFRNHLIKIFYKQNYFRPDVVIVDKIFNSTTLGVCLCNSLILLLHSSINILLAKLLMLLELSHLHNHYQEKRIHQDHSLKNYIYK